MIEKLQSGSRSAVHAMTRSSEETISVVSQASEAGVSLTIISSAVEHINDMSNQIAGATEQITSANTELATLSANLYSLVTRFKV